MIHFRDPNGYVLELTAKRPPHDQAMDPRDNGARNAGPVDGREARAGGDWRLGPLLVYRPIQDRPRLARSIRARSG